MKTILTVLSFLSIFSNFSQTWCDAGASWKYSHFNFAIEGYTEINYIGDTVINGQSVQLLDKHINAYDFISSQYIDIDLGEEFTYESNGVVYLWYNNDWDTLYNFNADIGESWRMAKQPFLNACDSNSTLTVTATGNKLINGITLKYLVVDFNFPFGYSDTIVEKIGFISSYMLPYDICDGALDAHEGGAFRCYQDNNFSTYKPHFSEDCDFIVGIEENTIERDIVLVPNPAASHIEIMGDLSGNIECILTDINGKLWAVIKENNKIDVSHLPKGLYILTVQLDKDISHHRFVVQ